MTQQLTKVIVPWHNRDQLEKFIDAWRLDYHDDRIIFQQDREQEGCAVTKNKGITRAISEGAETLIILEDDCFPHEGQTIDQFINQHLAGLKPQPVKMFDEVTEPVSRGTPYNCRHIEMPVAACMGFWTHIGDYDAPAQLVHGPTKRMKFDRQARAGRYFPLCGMNLSFRASEFPWCQFVDVPRFDDIWQGLLWQKKAYSEGKCFNLAGPLVRHSRQSNVWQNLRDEAENLEKNETLWQKVHKMELGDYDQMVRQILAE